MFAIRPSRLDDLREAGRFWLWRLVVVFGLLTAIMHLIAVLPGVPYNIQELFGIRPALPRSMLFALVALLALSPPAFLGLQLVRLPASWAWVFPLGIVIHGLIVFLAYRFATPIDSLHDMVGLPSGELPAEIERWFRFMGLFAMVSVPIAGGAGLLFTATRAPVPMRFLSWIVFAALALVVSWWIVVVQSATENMTLLLRQRGSLLSLLFVGFSVFVMAFAAGLVAQRLAQVMKGATAVVFGVLLCLPLSYWALMLGLTPTIGEGDHGLSAMDFLFSPSRTDYPTGSEVLLRYSGSYLVAVAVLALCQYPVWLGYVVRRVGIARPMERLMPDS